MRFAKILALLTLVVAVAPFGFVQAGGQHIPSVTMPHYDHIFVIVEENHDFNQIIGNPNAPTINQLAKTYGLAMKYYGAIHPSEGNYVAMVGGNSYNIQDDNPYYTHTISKPSIVNQLESANLSWKGYFQTMPYPGFKGLCYPSCNKNDPLYASKHNGFLNFDYVQDSQQELLHLVPASQLAKDLYNNQVPNFSFIVPDQCHDMHGASPYCVTEKKLVMQADTYVKQLFSSISSSTLWTTGNNAIVIVWDEGNDNSGCCDANPGGGHVPAIVITNQGPRGVKDSTPYNHYSLLKTIEQGFGLGCIQFTCDNKNVPAMIPLFAK